MPARTRTIDDSTIRWGDRVVYLLKSPEIIRGNKFIEIYQKLLLATINSNPCYKRIEVRNLNKGF